MGYGKYRMKKNHAYTLPTTLHRILCFSRGFMNIHVLDAVELLYLPLRGFIFNMEDNPLWVLDFGVHKGKLLSDPSIPDDYVLWFALKDNDIKGMFKNEARRRGYSIISPDVFWKVFKLNGEHDEWKR